ncbi:hypothetical protein AB0B39_23570 [Micromonospora sp. NPDC049114]|uniref:hypothetical protein n=1 Tax=Micromonospora sp. NPDC049114 TaxID=3155498 RepID=UPI003409515E
MNLGLMALIGFVVWTFANRNRSRADGPHVAELRKLTAEVAALRGQIDHRTTDGQE